MVSSFCLKIPAAVYAGEDVNSAIRKIIREGVDKIVIFTDSSIRKIGLLDGLLALIEGEMKAYAVIDSLVSEPTVYQADAAIKLFRKEKADLIIAVGGGSVMDIAKLCSVLDTDEYTVFELLKNPGIAKKQVKTLMIPTTAGTGAEATPNSIVTVPEQELKVGIVNDSMVADYVILDVNMIKKLPLSIATSTGIDALAHGIECYTSNKATPFSDMFAMEAMRLIFNNILPACLEGDIEAKKNMLFASFYAGVAIAAAGTTGVHALSYPLGGKYHIAHGVSNAMLLAPVMRFNMGEINPELCRIYDVIYHDSSIPNKEKPEKVIERLEEIVEALKIPTDLSTYGVSLDDLDSLVEAAMQVKRLLVNNKREITPADARALYLQIMPKK